MTYMHYLPNGIVRPEPVRLELKPDECVVIARRGGDAAALKRAWNKLNRTLRKMPLNTVDTVAELAASRETRGHV